MLGFLPGKPRRQCSTASPLCCWSQDFNDKKPPVVRGKVNKHSLKNLFQLIETLNASYLRANRNLLQQFFFATSQNDAIPMDTDVGKFRWNKIDYKIIINWMNASRDTLWARCETEIFSHITVCTSMRTWLCPLSTGLNMAWKFLLNNAEAVVSMQKCSRNHNIIKSCAWFFL